MGNGKIISFANFKGGVGKTSTTALVAYNMAKRLDKKILVIDFDPQANITNLLVKTLATNASESEVVTVPFSFMNIILDNIPIKDVILKIDDNLDLIPNADIFYKYIEFLEDTYPNRKDRKMHLTNLLKDIRKDYDYIFIDVSPTLSLSNDNAFIACDYIAVVLQTQERSLQGAYAFLDYLAKELKSNYNNNLEVVGIVPVLTKNGMQIDKEVLEDAKEIWGEEWLFKTIISMMERIKRIDKTGITDNPTDIHDKNLHNKFLDLSNELLDRINELES